LITGDSILTAAQLTALEKAKSMWTTSFLIAELHKPLDKARVKRSIVMRLSEPYQRGQR
jgi:hypothetical protein